MERVRALDGLRGIALLGVVLYHVAPGLVRGGFLGVEMFFVLSGFLLISLLLREERRRGLIDPWAYAARRARRILPALAVLLLAVAALAPLVARADAHRVPGDIFSSLLGATNWHLIADGSSYFARSGRPSFVRHLWSIAVELQVYVLVPFIAAFLARNPRRRSAALLLGGIATSAILMGVLYAAPDPSRAYYGTDTRIGALLTGALVALVAGGAARGRRPRLTSRATTVLFVCGLFVALALFVVAEERARVLYPAGFLATQAATAALIVAALQPGWASQALCDRRLRWFGVRSYGIYLWHWPLVVLLRPGADAGWRRALTAAVTVAGAVLLGGLSYRYVERPFLRATTWAARPLPRVTRLGTTAWVAATLLIVGVVARTAAPDPVAESLLAGEVALAQQGEGAASPVDRPDPPDVSTRGGKPQAAGRPIESPEKVPNREKSPGARAVKISAVGDSVMLGAAGAMKSRFGRNSHINAAKNRMWRDAPSVVRDWRTARRLGRVLVVHLGHNGPARLEEIESVLKEAKPTKNVLLVTVRVPKPWEGAVNDALRATAKKHKKVWLVDWHAVSAGHREWFYSDGTHMTRAGAEAYADLIAKKIPAKASGGKAKKRPKRDADPRPKPSPTPGLMDGVLSPY